MSSISSQAETLYISIFTKKNEEEIYKIITNTSLSDRISISRYYKGAYDSSLFSDIQSKIGGDFGYCAGLMFLSPVEFCLHHLKLGLKKNEETIFEVLTSKTCDELKIIEKIYKMDTGLDLKAEISKKYKSPISRNLLFLFEVPRSTNTNPRKNECERLGKLLTETDIKNWVEDEKIFKEIFVQKSPEELVLIARYYLKNTGHNLIDVIYKKTKGKHQILLKEILYNNVMPHELFAEKIYLAIKGAGTNEEVLSRVLVSRFEIDMPLIREMYQYKYNQNMSEDIIGDTSGFYQKLCVYLCEK